MVPFSDLRQNTDSSDSFVVFFSPYKQMHVKYTDEATIAFSEVPPNLSLVFHRTIDGRL
jgi:hypothetical protein